MTRKRRENEAKKYIKNNRDEGKKKAKMKKIRLKKTKKQGTETKNKQA